MEQNLAKQEFEEYLASGVLGGYNPENAVLLQEADGKIDTIFHDTEMRVENGDFVQERKMLVNGKRFIVTSVFPGEATATPTEKMLSYIDTEMKKEARGA